MLNLTSFNHNTVVQIDGNQLTSMSVKAITRWQHYNDAHT